MKYVRMTRDFVVNCWWLINSSPDKIDHDEGKLLLWSIIADEIKLRQYHKALQILMRLALIILILTFLTW